MSDEQARQPTNAAAEPLLRLEAVAKSFGAVHALRGVDLTAAAGQVTALVGDNGAGKSVTVKVIAGTYLPDKGQLYWQAKPVKLRSPRESAALGIEVVYQDLALCDNLDVVQNMYLGRELTRNGLLVEDAMESAAMKTLADLRVTTVQSVRLPVAAMSGGQRQSVAVAKAVMWNSKLVILDEPTAALGVAQTHQVLTLVRRLAERGLGVIIISHNLTDVFAVADSIAVMRLGRVVSEGPASATDVQTVVEQMTTGVRAA